MPTVEFHFDFGSPNAYLSHLVIPQIEQRTGVSFDYIPVLLGGVFKATNNVSPAVSLAGIKNKPDYGRIETERFLTAYGVEGYVANPHFPVMTLVIMRGAVAAQRLGELEPYCDAMYRAMWVDARNMSEIEEIGAVLLDAGLALWATGSE